MQTLHRRQCRIPAYRLNSFMFIVLADEQKAMVTNVRHLANKVLCYINDKKESFDNDELVVVSVADSGEGK
ncbi:hypothetical protein [Pantoea stewartii]|uniref:Uncharacterized protein n=2 Tax=Pantoea stewartii subsp. stewartii DC283 TaxID=660596 RepID=A0ABM6K5K4_PANSE|nr:hypothetical protein [Pantoea stewartii]ARF49997.1 hypothetical protein DSJ_12015 [Pantoea stewartii subsp. stewartii DC283]